MKSVQPASLQPLPTPPNYMHAALHNQVREMKYPAPLPDRDHRSAEQMVDQSPVLHLFMNSNDYFEVSDELKMQLGDWSEANTNPKCRAQAMYNLDLVLRFIDNLDDRQLNASQSRNGVVDGFSHYGYTVQPNSEASVLKAFARKGYEVFRHIRA